MSKRKRIHDPDEILARIRPKPARRWFAIVTTGLLALILIYVAAAFPPVDLAWLVFLAVLGLACAYWAWLVWKATSVDLVLTPTELREETGRRLCAIEDVDRVDSGFFAFKPAAGFLVHLRTPMSRVYAPGLWWRAGRRVAVGGVTSRAEGKAVAEIINVMLSERDGGGR